MCFVSEEPKALKVSEKQMNLTLIRSDRTFVYSLPEEVTGKHWLYDVNPDGRQRKIAAIDARDGQWEISSYGNTSLFSADGTEAKCLKLSDKLSLYRFLLPEEKTASLLAETPTESSKRFTKIGFAGDLVISIGQSPENMIYFDNPYVSSQHALLYLEREQFSILDTADKGGVYVNTLAVPKGVKIPLRFGDIVDIMTLRIVIGRRFIAINNPGGVVRVAPHPTQVSYTPQIPRPVEEQSFEEDELDFFYRSPRIKRDIESKKFDIEAPPHKEKSEESPAILKIGPSVGMALGSSMMGLYMISMIISGQGTLLRALPMISMMIVMILGAILWPNLSRRYERRKGETKESKRKVAYASYLDKNRTSLQEEMAQQKEILEENRITVAECLRRTISQDRRLFERTVLHSDFLELRIGCGDVSLNAEVKFPQDQLTIEEDLLKSLVYDLAQQPRTLVNVPLSLSLIDEHVCGVVSKRSDYYPFLRGLIAQICALHAPDEVKLVFFGDLEDEQEWRFIRTLPHMFDSSMASRFLITEHTEATEITLRLEREIQQRSSVKADHPGDYGIYYVVFVANRELASTVDVLARLNSLRTNKGFTVLTFAEKIRELPKECTRIIELAGVTGNLYDPRDASGERLEFTSDISLTSGQAEAFAESLAAIRLDQAEAHSSLPRSLSFLEMFEAGMVEHLNIKTRWAESNPALSLAAPLGVDAMGELSQLDIHEDFHGPHGLIAGMTGSGKSEAIITYILSLAVNYRPDEVSFVLIDYKGGGLAGAFDNERVRLPHLAGTITNLDGAAIRRSLVSINSELRHRQDVFNQARDIAGESTMDIYKYQTLYREGRVSEPIPHLVIISDEFAELKSQEPEFMSELISAARIGRSLGVHLILATQKPSGVVNDQIWSNAKFKICLKVAEAADSREMLKRSDAAELVDAGRFYLQVGYNEFFAMGQSAYSGASYVPKEEFEPRKDNNVVLINNNGRPLMAARPEIARQAGTKIPEVHAVLMHIAEVAQQMGLKAPALWIDPIPAHISLANLKDRYPQKTTPFILNPIIGEYDDPANQRQHLLTLPLSENGNTIIYGAVGTGVESVLNTLLFSLLGNHDARELNIYVLDFGAETLGVFRGAPQVGDVLFSGDEDKVNRLFSMLRKETDRRKKALSISGKNFAAHNAKASSARDTFANIVVVLNDILAFYELYPKLEESIITLSREANRYGIYFVITANQANAVRLRLRTNFKQYLVLQFNDQTDYSAIFGTLRGIPIPTGYGRGLVSRDGIFEFQTAFVNEIDDTESHAVQQVIKQLYQNKTKSVLRAPRIPVLPTQVTLQHLLSEKVEEDQIPFGLFEKSIEPAYLSFEYSPFVRCLFNRTRDGVAFIDAFISLLDNQQDYYEPLIIDYANLLPNRTVSIGRIIQDEQGALAVFEKMLMNCTRHDKKPFFVLMSGIASFLRHINPSKATAIRDYLKTLGEEQGAVFFLFDNAIDATYSSEEWFKLQVGSKSGLWVGEGLGSQNAYNLNYGTGQSVDPTVKGDRGYVVVDGSYSVVKYVTSDDLSMKR